MPATDPVPLTSDNKGPKIELSVHLHYYIRSISFDGSLITTASDYTVSECLESTASLFHDADTSLDGVIHAMLSFPEIDSMLDIDILDLDVYGTYGSVILPHVQQAVEGLDPTAAPIRVKAIICYWFDAYSEKNFAIAWAVRRRAAKRRRIKRIEARMVLENKESIVADEMCTVCREELVKGGEVARMPCSHCFHKECAVKWLLKGSKTCPICRFQV